MENKEPSFFTWVAIHVENIIMTKLVPKENPGVVFKWLFKVPILFYKAGLPLFGDFILLLTTTGRKSRKPHHTPLEYHLEEGSGYCVITAGWGGKTDWAKNIIAYPHVHAQAGQRHFNARAEALTNDEVTAWLAHVVEVNPASLKIWSRWADEELDGSLESMRKAAKYFPSFRLIPE